MQSTKNYQLVKQELTDVPDITQISGNWDKIDAEMKKLSDDKFDKTGGTVSGATTFEKGTTTKGGATVDTLTVQWGTTTDTLNVKGESTLGGDITINGKVITDNVRAKGQSLNVGVTLGGSELVGFIAQLVGGTTPRLSVTHHPDKASNDKQVATTNWVKSLIATQSEYGLVKLATEEDIIECDPQAVVHTPMMYEINDFRRVNTAYELEEKVACAFEYEYFLECTKAGTTSGDLLDTRNVTFGQVIVDGTVEWTVRAHVRSINGAVADEHGNVKVNEYSHPNSGVTSGTYNNVTVDEQGHVTGGDTVNYVKTVNGKIPDGGGNISVPTFSGNYNDLTNKPTIPPNPNSYIIDSWRSGNSWYRKWNNGFVEQGGYIKSMQTGNQNHTLNYSNIKLHVPFNHKNYFANVFAEINKKSHLVDLNICVWSKQNSEFQTRNFDPGNADICTASWYACGYL